MRYNTILNIITLWFHCGLITQQQLEELEKMRDEFVPQRTPSTEGADSDDDEDYDTVEALGGKQ